MKKTAILYEILGEYISIYINIRYNEFSIV